VNRYYHVEALRSTAFTLSVDGNTVHFHGKGWGHGVGLCQSGAVTMARRGKTYDKILAHYFPGTQISQLPATPARPDPSLRRYISALFD